MVRTWFEFSRLRAAVLFHDSNAWSKTSADLRDTNEKAWRWEYLGEITGTGGAVFNNVHEASLSDGRIHVIERIRNGVDWG